MEYRIRDFQCMADFRECVELQEAVWGDGFSERVPVAILRVSQRLGGVAAGAYDEEGTLAAFVFGLTGVQEGELVHWSDMLAVRPGLRDSGLGTRLKLYQREVVLRKGVARMLWTFDPLESRNAYLNLERLGAVSREYVEDMYGESNSPLHQGLATDRLVALWELESHRAERAAARGAGGAGHDLAKVEEEGGETVREALGVVAGSRGSGDWPRPGTPRLDLDAQIISVAVPAAIQELRDGDPALAGQWREVTRRTLSHYLAGGWEVRHLRRGGPVSRYLLVRTGS
jgi:predicted GNAT superfamily acetyltransferase